MGDEMSNDKVVVGFVGLGTMGSRMAANLQKAGFRLVVHDLQRQTASHHLNAGAIWAESPLALASQCEVIFTSLPEPPDVEAVALGPDGLMGGVKPGTAYFDLSTNSPSVVKKLNAAFAEKGAHMLDAPVSGGPAGAASRKLAIWVGGDENVFKHTRPCSMRSATNPPISGRSAARPWPSSCTTCPAMRSSVRSPKASAWA